ncbi:hypothetical protein [Agromyces bauzanensis]
MRRRVCLVLAVSSIAMLSACAAGQLDVPDPNPDPTIPADFEREEDARAVIECMKAAGFDVHWDEENKAVAGTRQSTESADAAGNAWAQCLEAEEE